MITYVYKHTKKENTKMRAISFIYNEKTLVKCQQTQLKYLKDPKCQYKDKCYPAPAEPLKKLSKVQIPRLSSGDSDSLGQK